MKFLDKVIVNDGAFFDNAEGRIIDLKHTDIPHPDHNRGCIIYEVYFDAINKKKWIDEDFIKKVD